MLTRGSMRDARAEPVDGRLLRRRLETLRRGQVEQRQAHGGADDARGSHQALDGDDQTRYRPSVAYRSPSC